MEDIKKMTFNGELEKVAAEEESDFKALMYDESGDKKEAKTEAEHSAPQPRATFTLARKGPSLEDEGGAAGTDAIVDRTDSSKEEVEKAMDNMQTLPFTRRVIIFLATKIK